MIAAVKVNTPRAISPNINHSGTFLRFSDFWTYKTKKANTTIVVIHSQNENLVILAKDFWNLVCTISGFSILIGNILPVIVLFLPIGFKYGYILEYRKENKSS